MKWKELTKITQCSKGLLLKKVEELIISLSLAMVFFEE